MSDVCQCGHSFTSHRNGLIGPCREAACDCNNFTAFVPVAASDDEVTPARAAALRDEAEAAWVEWRAEDAYMCNTDRRSFVAGYLAALNGREKEML